jgi:hypothetical protein
VSTFGRMCGTSDPGSCIRWVLGFGIKTGYDKALGPSRATIDPSGGVRNQHRYCGSPTFIVVAIATPQSRTISRSRSSRRSTSNLRGGNRSRHRGWVGMPLPRKWTPPGHAGAYGQVKGGDENSSNHAALDRVGKSKDVDLQQTIDALHQQEQEPPMQELSLQ